MKNLAFRSHMIVMSLENITTTPDFKNIWQHLYIIIDLENDPGGKRIIMNIWKISSLTTPKLIVSQIIKKSKSNIFFKKIKAYMLILLKHVPTKLQKVEKKAWGNRNSFLQKYTENTIFFAIMSTLHKAREPPKVEGHRVRGRAYADMLKR